MEELFQYMKTFHYQINDVADQAAKVSVEEHMQYTTIQALEKDLDLVKNETTKVKEETDRMAKAKGQICLQIMEKQKRTASLESDSYTLCRTLALMQQERLSLSSKLVDQSTYYKKVTEDLICQLKGQQEWLNAQNFHLQVRECLVNEKAGEPREFLNDGDRNITMDLQSAKTKFDSLEQQKSHLVLENAKLKQTVELAKAKIAEFKPELREMNEKSLEEELQALSSDKAREAEYVQSLQHQIMTVNEISHKVRCSCGEEYTVEFER